MRYRPGTYLTDWTEGVLTPALESFTKILDGGYGLWAEHRNQRLLQRLRIAIELVMSREQDAHLFAAMGHLCPMHALVDQDIEVRGNARDFLVQNSLVAEVLEHAR